ncbi:hypothetical protein TOPH_04130 [Tolypocladium ophioglossoides CBS 100239]|uniref:Uncharacterized protein n=1 Tax=Tolypocladium ophioglossoides (strain CBS 100239) TaxID=1163406 RepID=A0A0L0NB12_TOLOC|nr:hypothetical protein TOPH_04130 [Tolypocladium ophioglossoides CBS 100239]
MASSALDVTRLAGSPLTERDIMMHDHWAGGNVGPWCPRGGWLCDRPRPESDAKGKPDVPATTCDMTEASADSRNAEKSHLMSLPLETRLQIYHWVHLMNPIRQRAPSPGYPTPEIKRCVQRPVPDADDACDGIYDGVCGDDHDARTNARRTESPVLLCPNRPLCGLPSSLLRTSRQICLEARSIPFETNEFVFVTWFTSGLWAASAAVAGVLVPWQREAMRYARIEVMERDLQEEASLRAWKALSETWTGLRGLRVKIALPGAGSIAGPESGLGDAAETWASRGGLAKMEALERLEVELDAATWDNGRKLAWCVALGRCLRERGSRSQVVCTERAAEEDEEEAKGQVAGY